MMDEQVVRLFPSPPEGYPLEGLYLAHNLREQAGIDGKPFVYSNFVISLDGRIAIPHVSKAGMMVPKQTANDRDWRLFQELAIQADLIISTGRYLRDYADGRAQEILRVYDDPQFADLKEWRQKRGLRPQPDLAVISASLSFPIPEILTQGERSVLIYTVAEADPQRVKELEKQTGRVIAVGEKSVDGRALVASLAELGYRTVYSSAGPKVHYLLLEADVLDRMYLTHTHRVLGARPFSSIVEGELLDPARDFRLHALYHDPAGLDGLGQLFVAYDRAK